jgi:hypothetical protein
VWDVIADFVVTGKAQVEELHPEQQKKSVWVELLGRCPPVVWMAIAASVWGIWQVIAFLIHTTVPDVSSQAFATGFAFAIYFLLLWLVLTRV